MEKANAQMATDAGVTRGAASVEGANAQGRYVAECYDSQGNLKWRDEFDNVVCTEGKNAALTHYFKGSTYSAGSIVMGLISSTNYSTGPAATNTAGSISTATATNGWCELVNTIVAARGTASFGTASGGSLSLSANVAFSIIGSGTIKGCFLLTKDTASVAPTTTVGNTAGAMWSSALFSGGDKTVSNGDSLNVSYTTSL